MITLLALLAPWAYAGDDDDDLDLDDDIDLPAPTPPTPAPPTPAPPAPAPDDGDDRDTGLDTFRDADDTDLLGEDGRSPTSGDTEQIYRQTQERLAELDVDEQIQGWEAYLARYPNTPYRTRIEKVIEDLNDQLYADRIGGPEGGPVDANKQELTFAHPLQLENVNPRTRLNVAFEYGLPSYANLAVDYEHALVRKFSVHGGIKQRYLGFNVEAGARFAFVKSPRTKMLVTGTLDFRFNVNPAYPGLRPQLAVAKRFGKLDLMISGGTDLVLFDGVKPNILGGGMLYYAASERVGIFLEGNAYLRNLPADSVFDGGTAMFDVATFGLKFFPGKEGSKQNKEANLGTTVPFATRYWQFHYGSIMGQFNYYL